jgi:hypothetical protein
LNEIEGRLMGVLVILDFDEIIRDRNFVVEVRTEEELRDRLFLNSSNSIYPFVEKPARFDGEI